jgi:hypothetical protein
MSILRLLFLLSGLAFAPLAAAADVSLGDRLVGVWREYSPSSNIVRFEKDGTTTLYLKKGEIGNLRTLDGKWTVSDTGMLSIVYTVGEKSMTLQARLSYEGEEMILTEASGEQTKHRRHTGPIPEIYVW